MKKSLFLLMMFLVFIFPVIAQEDSEQVPEEILTLKQGNIPPQILKSAEQLFQGSTQVKWGVFPYELKDYGWVVNKEYNEPIDHYEIQLKAKDGSDVDAVFESTGQLIRYNLVKKNAPVPASVLGSIKNSPYKDWKIIGDIMLVSNNQKRVVDHYVVKVENGNKKKTLFYTVKGEALANK
jgi:hypothetical protein